MWGIDIHVAISAITIVLVFYSHTRTMEMIQEFREDMDSSLSSLRHDLESMNRKIGVTTHELGDMIQKSNRGNP